MFAGAVSWYGPGPMPEEGPDGSRPPWLFIRDDYWRCSLCNKVATPDHIISQEHTRKRSHYLYYTANAPAYTSPPGPPPPPSAYTGPPGPPPAPTPPPAPGIPPLAAWTSPAAIVQSAAQSVGTSNDSLALRMTVLDDQVTDVSNQLRRLNDTLCAQGLPRPPQGAAPNSSMPPTSTPTTAAASATADKITELEGKVVQMSTLLENLLSRVGRLETTVTNPGETEEQNQGSEDGFLAVSPTS